jgi:hypothetical protein
LTKSEIDAMLIMRRIDPASAVRCGEKEED